MYRPSSRTGRGDAAARAAHHLVQRLEVRQRVRAHAPHTKSRTQPCYCAHEPEQTDCDSARRVSAGRLRGRNSTQNSTKDARGKN
eukprot:4199227-Prymnesium_polylepis.1